MRCTVGIAFLACTGLAMAQSTTAARNAKPVSAASGEQMYTNYCAACHGSDGKGSGPAASAMKRPPTDLSVLAKNNGGRFPSNKVVASIQGDANVAAHGSRDMPVWGGIFRGLSQSDDAQVKMRLANLTKHIEKLQVK